MRVQNVFTHLDRCRLGRLLESDDARGMAPWHRLDKLEYLLEEAATMQAESIPDDVVTMNSTVKLVHVDSGRTVTCTVVYPEDVDLIERGVSVLEPLGTCLIGCEAGDLVDCETLTAPGKWRIAEIVFQPERAGNFGL